MHNHSKKDKDLYFAFIRTHKKEGYIKGGGGTELSARSKQIAKNEALQLIGPGEKAEVEEDALEWARRRAVLADVEVEKDIKLIKLYMSEKDFNKAKADYFGGCWSKKEAQALLDKNENKKNLRQFFLDHKVPASKPKKSEPLAPLETKSNKPGNK